MPTTSAKLGIAKPLTTDDFDTSEIAANWQLVDDHPGVYICTNATRPTWGANQDGMLIYETDTQRYYRWRNSDTSFVRDIPRGYLGGNTKTTNTTNATTTPASLLSETGVVALGDRTLQITVGWPDATGSGKVYLYRGGTKLTERHIDAGTGDSSKGGQIVFFDTPSAATYTYEAQLVADTGDSLTVVGASGAPVTIDVVEV